MTMLTAQCSCIMLPESAKYKILLVGAGGHANSNTGRVQRQNANNSLRTWYFSLLKQGQKTQQAAVCRCCCPTIYIPRRVIITRELSVNTENGEKSTRNVRGHRKAAAGMHAVDSVFNVRSHAATPALLCILIDII